MTFFDSITTVFRKFAEFGGRATRPEFWWFTLFSALVAGALGSLNLTSTTGTFDAFRMMGEQATATTTTFYLGSSLAAVWSFVVLLPSLAVTVRRLRDAGHKWAEIFWILLPIAGVIILIVRLCDPTVQLAPQAPAPAAPPAP
ncbi:uncharacterized membrane protein YhaH (DUF805 family) [Leifsonia sp. AK011]|uniref:DUF805 domain-containing protein n=1 Tax=Leifsonia sp. AK011 TaxID=2723075 RepID=UPI0015CE10F4|nr:DUF805 domain-containing protein [Leifsonia sp. AK011]NYF10456.1 uncharacterized membrane protein YhaH (DUF805 family) [Leifsonia sp. AK011]